MIINGTMILVTFWSSKLLDGGQLGITAEGWLHNEKSMTLKNNLRLE